MSASAKIVHAADLHLGAPVKCEPFDGFDPTDAPWQALDALVQLCIDEEASALLLAGDQFDQGDPQPQTERRFYDAIRRLDSAEIPVFMVLGNHDAAYFQARKLTAPDNLHLFATDHAETKQFVLGDGTRAAIHGRSFPASGARVGPEFAQSYPAPQAGLLNIGLLHSSLESPDWAPIAVNDLLARGYDYWALGHEHKPALWGEPGAQAAYCGNLQGRDIGEAGTRGANILNIDGRRIASIEPRFLGSALWQQVIVDVTDCNDIEEVERSALKQLEALDTATRKIVRVRLTGQSPVHADSFRHQLRLAEALNERTAARVHVASVRSDVTPNAMSQDPIAVDWPITREDFDEAALAKLTKRLNVVGLPEVTPSADLAQAERMAKALLGQASE